MTKRETPKYWFNLGRDDAHMKREDLGPTLLLAGETFAYDWYNDGRWVGEKKDPTLMTVTEYMQKRALEKRYET